MFMSVGSHRNPLTKIVDVYGFRPYKFWSSVETSWVTLLFKQEVYVPKV